jgi:hypothetical protein
MQIGTIMNQTAELTTIDESDNTLDNYEVVSDSVTITAQVTYELVVNQETNLFVTEEDTSKCTANEKAAAIALTNITTANKDT